MAAFRVNRVSLRGLYPRYTLLSVLLVTCRRRNHWRMTCSGPTRRFAANTMAKTLTPFGVFREECGRSTVMHLPSGKAGFNGTGLVSPVARIGIVDRAGTALRC